MKQTAVEWLVDYIENQNKNGYEFHPKYNEHIVKQAKEMEKQQIIDACQSTDNTDFWIEYDNYENYYNKTFKNENT